MASEQVSRFFRFSYLLLITLLFLLLPLLLPFFHESDFVLRFLRFEKQENWRKSAENRRKNVPWKKSIQTQSGGYCSSLFLFFFFVKKTYCYTDFYSTNWNRSWGSRGVSTKNSFRKKKKNPRGHRLRHQFLIAFQKEKKRKKTRRKERKRKEKNVTKVKRKGKKRRKIIKRISNKPEWRRNEERERERKKGGEIT